MFKKLSISLRKNFFYARNFATVGVQMKLRISTKKMQSIQRFICHKIDFTAFGLYRDHPQALILNNFKKFLNLSKQKVLIFKKYSLKRVSSKNVQSSDFLLDYDSPNSTGPSFLRFITKVDFQIFGLTQI